MKKTFKRAGVAVLSMAMLLSMGAVGLTVNAVAARTATVTIADSAKLPSDATTTIYKVAAASSSGWAWCDSFEFTAAQRSALQELIPTGATVTTISSDKDIFKVLDDATVTNDSAFVKKLAAILDDKSNWTTSFSVSSSSATVTDDAEDAGYYLAITTTSDASYIVQPILFELTKDDTTYTVNTPKATNITLTKTITAVTNSTTNESTADGGVNGSVRSGGKAALAAAGDTISYKLAVNLPTYESSVTSLTTDYQIVDEMSDTLTYTASTIVVKNTTDDKTLQIKDGTHTTAGTGTDDYQYEVTEDSTHKFTITLADAYVLANSADSIEVTFNATLSATAPNYGTTSNENKAKATFDNKFDGTSGNGTTTEDKVDVYAAKLKVTKTKDDDGALNGAGFTLYVKDKNGSYQTVETITNATGNTFEFKKLTAGEYKLKETTVPTGYNEAADVIFTVSDTDYDGTYVTDNGNVAKVSTEGTLETTVKNIALETLPGTGGIGTTLFTVGGAAVVLLAGFMFVVYMKKRKIEE